MKRFTANRYYFIASVLSLGLGIPGQARAANGGCDGRTEIHRKLVWGDSLSQISKDVYGTFFKYDLITDAKGNKINDPDHVYEGATVIVPCEVPQVLALRTFVPPSTPAIQPMEMTTEEPPSAELPTPVVPTLPTVLLTATTTPTAQRPPVSEPAPEPLQVQAEPEMTVTAAIVNGNNTTLQPMATHAPISPTADNTPMGWYAIELSPEQANLQAKGITAGQFPALLLRDQNKKDFWKQRYKTVVIITQTSNNGNFIINMNFRTPPSPHSAIAIDLGGGNFVQIGGDIVARDGRITTVSSEPKLFARKKYGALLSNVAFMKKPALALTFARKTIPIVLPAALGFVATGGNPLGAILGGGLPMARSFISAKIMRAQTPPSEAMAPHVQYVIGEQGDKLNSLQAQMNELKKEIETLKKESGDKK